MVMDSMERLGSRDQGTLAARDNAEAGDAEVCAWVSSALPSHCTSLAYQPLLYSDRTCFARYAASRTEYTLEGEATLNVSLF